MNKPLKHQLLKFVIVGLLTVAIDFLIYRALIYFEMLDAQSLNLAKGLGFVGGTIFAYFANRFWTFNPRSMRAGSTIRFSLVYLLSLGVNIAVNKVGIALLGQSHAAYEWILVTAFILATGISATLNFIGMKVFVFAAKTANTS
jgi:putative flippase GtrA